MIGDANTGSIDINFDKKKIIKVKVFDYQVYGEDSQFDLY